MDGDDKHKLVSHVDGDEEPRHEWRLAADKDQNEEVGIGGIVGGVEEQQDGADVGVDAKDARHHQSVLATKPSHTRPPKRLAREQQGVRAVEVGEGEHAEEDDGDEEVGVDAKDHQQRQVDEHQVDLEEQHSKPAERAAEEVVVVLKSELDCTNVQKDHEQD